jgi:hypothetical protein
MSLTGNIGPDEVLEASGVIEVQVAHDDGFHVFDIVTSGLDRIRQLHLVGVDGTREEISEWCAPFLYHIVKLSHTPPSSMFG